MRGEGEMECEGGGRDGECKRVREGGTSGE